MRTTVRRVGAAAVSTLIAGAFVAGPAHAETRAETFLGSATSTALNLNVLGQKLTLGYSKADASNPLKAVAEAAGQLLAPASSSKAETTADNTSKQDANKCATPALPEALAAILNIGAGCSSSFVEVKNGIPHAVSEGSVAMIDLKANQVLNQVIAPVQTALEGIFGQLEAVVPQLNPVTDTVSELVTALGNTQTLAVRLGKATSEVSTTAKSVVSTATAAGGQIDLLPLGGLDNGPLVSIVVGSAKATATYDRATGISTPTFDPALVRVRLALPVLGQVQEISVPIGQTIKILEGTPLESEIVVADGKQVKNADGSVKAIADGVALRLLKGINGGINLELAHAEAATVGALPLTETPRVVEELPRTGGTPWLPVAGATAIAGAYLTRRYVLNAQ